MSQLSFMTGGARRFTVSELTRYIRQLLESDYRLGDVTVSGEISNLSRPASGHLYFSLKDASASLRCVMWRSEVAQQAYLPLDGQAVEVHGHVSLYEAGGQYQLYADDIRPAGEGELYRAFLRLRDKLQAEGLFDPARKRELPAWPLTIGVVTSPGAAALRDVVDVLARRFPLANVILSPTPVQGADAPEGIVRALESVAAHAQPDVILLVRGGGSIEDLAAFNDEGVARAIAASPVPVVSGVGHETDFTIADFVADVRAPTPSAAAEIASPSLDQLAANLHALAVGLQVELEGQRRALKRGLDQRLIRLRLASPRAQLANASQRVDELGRRLAEALRHDLALRGAEVRRLAQALTAVGPPSVLNRGYALVTRAADGALVRSPRQVKAGQQIRVRVADGRFGARVEPDEDPESRAE